MVCIRSKFSNIFFPCCWLFPLRPTCSSPALGSFKETAQSRYTLSPSVFYWGRTWLQEDAALWVLVPIDSSALIESSLGVCAVEYCRGFQVDHGPYNG